jgi:hypothetical protein
MLPLKILMHLYQAHWAIPSQITTVSHKHNKHSLILEPITISLLGCKYLFINIAFSKRVVGDDNSADQNN